MRSWGWGRMALIGVMGFLAACATPPRALPPQQAPIRFLLSFDDGPSARPSANPSEQVLDTLAHNDLQPGIRALYFVQTATTNGGATPIGQRLLRRIAQDGHVLAFHTATPGHTSHPRLSDDALETSLRDGLRALTALAGRPPRLVRPPHWAYDLRSFAAYTRHGLGMLLTDLHANDGKVMWPNGSPRRRSHFENQLHALRARLHELPVVDGVHPVVVTFHDTNPFTAAHLQEYLHILVNGAAKAGLRLDAQAFYADGPALEAAALHRVVRSAEQPIRIPGFWSSLWAWIAPRS